jgi:GGDEF domain-containing protein
MNGPSTPAGKSKLRRRFSMYRAREVRKWLAGEPGSLTTVLMLGIKDLKQINDRLGRGAGDWAIRRVGERLHAFAALQLV